MGKLAFWRVLKDAAATSGAIAEELVGVERELPIAEAAAVEAEQRFVALLMEREGGGHVEPKGFDKAAEAHEAARLRVLTLKHSAGELRTRLVQVAERETGESLARTQSELAAVEEEVGRLRAEAVGLAARLFALLARIAPQDVMSRGYGETSLAGFTQGRVSLVWGNVDNRLLQRCLGRGLQDHLPNDEVFPLLEAEFEKAGLLLPGAPIAPPACLYAGQQALRTELEHLKAKDPTQEAEAVLARLRSQG